MAPSEPDPTAPPSPDPPSPDPVDLSVRLLRAVRTGEDPTALEARLATLDEEALAEGLATDDDRIAFWCDLYNAGTQLLLDRDPERFESKRRFFGTDCLAVAGHDLSLDAIEHGLLRRSKLKLGFGYLPNPFPGAFERRFRVDELDARVHFALNCGARSCPPIAAYTPDDLDEQLELATDSYLDGSVAYDADRGVVRVPRLFLWYRGDFGGKAGILALLREFDQVPENARPRLKHREYDWTMEPGDYADARLE